MVSEKRYVITGMGILTKIGDSLDEYYNNLIAGKSGIGYWNNPEGKYMPCKVGGDLSGYDFKSALTEIKEQIPENVFKRVKKLSKTAPVSARLTMLTSLKAYIDAGLFDYEPDKERTCAVLGGHNFNNGYLYKNFKQFQEEPDFIDGLTGIVSYDTDIIASVSEILGIRGPVYSIGATCTSTASAIRSIIYEIESGECDIGLLAGGILDYSEVELQALVLINAISYRSFNDAPEKASRPYDKHREGFVPAQGSGVLVIEELEHAKMRGAKIYAEILGIEASSDGNHLSNPSVEGQSRLMKKVLDKSGVRPEQIDYINAHATSTPLGDTIEINSIKQVFGDYAYKLKVNATKSLIGHTGWSSAVIETIGAILQMLNSTLHPSINIDEIDPEVDIDVCANKKVENYNIDYLLKNSFGFGGLNCCMVLKKYKE